MCIQVHKAIEKCVMYINKIKTIYIKYNEHNHVTHKWIKLKNSMGWETILFRKKCVMSKFLFCK